MRISSINFNQTKSIFQNNKISFTKPNLTYDADLISFTSKTIEQRRLASEAKDLSKEAYRVFARGKKIQKQAQTYLNNANEVLIKAREMKESSSDKLFDIENSLEYAREYKIKAYADPINETQTIFYISNSGKFESMILYKDDSIIRRAEKKDGRVTLLEQDDKGKTTRTIFNAKTGELSRIDEGFEQIGKEYFYSDTAYEFEGGRLKKYSKKLYDNPRMKKAQEVYIFENGFLSEVALNSSLLQNDVFSTKEEYWFENDKITHYFKEKQGQIGAYLSTDEEYAFGIQPARYIKDKSDTLEGVSASKVFCFSDSKVQKAIIGLSADCDSRIIEKYFTYNKNEKPQTCFLNHQTNRTYEFDFDSDFNPIYDKLVYL